MTFLEALAYVTEHRRMARRDDWEENKHIVFDSEWGEAQGCVICVTPIDFYQTYNVPFEIHGDDLTAEWRVYDIS